VVLDGGGEQEDQGDQGEQEKQETGEVTVHEGDVRVHMKELAFDAWRLHRRAFGSRGKGVLSGKKSLTVV